MSGEQFAAQNEEISGIELLFLQNSVDRGGLPISNTASTTAFEAPSRMSSVCARSPRINLSPPTSIDFPAPVSPVRMFNPGPNSTSSSLISAKSRMYRDLSTDGSGQESEGLPAVAMLVFFPTPTRARIVASDLVVNHGRGRLGRRVPTGISISTLCIHIE